MDAELGENIAKGYNSMAWAMGIGGLCILVWLIFCAIAETAKGIADDPKAAAKKVGKFSLKWLKIIGVITSLLLMLRCATEIKGPIN